MADQATSSPSRITQGRLAARVRVAFFTALPMMLVLLGASCGREQPPPPAAAPPAVEVAAVVQRDVPIYIESIGTTRGDTEIEVRARVEGILESVNFKEGSNVKKGDLLYTIDPREYEANLQKAKGELAQAQADLARHEQDVARFRPLADENAVPRQTLDTAVAESNAARANVQAAQAAVVAAELNLSYTKVYSPTDGIIGKTEVNEGNLVGRGQSTLLTQISKVDPIRLRVSLNERDYLALARKRREEGVDTSSPGRVEMLLADGTIHPYKGRVVFADRLVDASTGTMLVDVAFPNPDKLIRPGQYGRARVAIDVRPNALLVPQKAVSALQSVDTVSVVKPDNTIETRQVKTGERVGSLWVIESGLRPDDRVVVEGLQKIRPGITVNASLVPSEPEAAATSGTGSPAN
jgi:membrane fusion protein (multidrug efflux system)